MTKDAISRDLMNARLEKIRDDARAGGYLLNPDVPFVESLISGMCVNEARYGYPACPCRLAVGTREADLDIICPCDYRDPDLNEYGACYCALYVSQDMVSGKRTLTTVPERRPPREQRGKKAVGVAHGIVPAGTLPVPVWRCRVCGYLCARDNPPLVCPICKASQDRFVQFL